MSMGDWKQRQWDAYCVYTRYFDNLYYMGIIRDSGHHNPEGRWHILMRFA